MSVERTGVYLIGACGSVATTCIVGASALAQGLARPTGMVSMLADFDPLCLQPLGSLVFGGCEIRRTTPLQSAHELCGPGGFLHPNHVTAGQAALEELETRLDPGILLGAGRGVRQLTSNPRSVAVRSPRHAVDAIQANLRAFLRETEVARVVVVNLASTEQHREQPPHYANLALFENALRCGEPEDFSTSVLIAYAALEAGFPYLNFTPSLGSSIPALIELARRRNVPHMGRDGKTGETLLKTTLAPMFLARQLRVLSWEGHNILGNRDGQVLDSPENNRAKQAAKAEGLDELLGDPDAHSRVRIDYVPSLADWKTAWDFIHFEGFLGTRMILQLIWQGCDSVLAAPLVLDMIRLLDHADRRGQGGLQPHLASFFKSPTGVTVHAFEAQYQLLRDYISHEAAQAPSSSNLTSI